MAQRKQPHTIAEFLILTGAKILVKGCSLPSPDLVHESCFLKVFNTTFEAV